MLTWLLLYFCVHDFNLTTLLYLGNIKSVYPQVSVIFFWHSVGIILCVGGRKMWKIFSFLLMCHFRWQCFSQIPHILTVILSLPNPFGGVPWPMDEELLCKYLFCQWAFVLFWYLSCVQLWFSLMFPFSVNRGSFSEGIAMSLCIIR